MTVDNTGELFHTPDDEVVLGLKGLAEILVNTFDLSRVFRSFVGQVACVKLSEKDVFLTKLLQLLFLSFYCTLGLL